jgi:tetratricopeptide (TPR) repeat protein
MRKLKIDFLSLAVVLIVVLFAAGGFYLWRNMELLRARNALNKGVQAFSTGDFVRAGNLFEEASDLDPDLTPARVYLAYSTMMQYTPGAEYPENVAIAEKALEGFKGVLEDDPGNSTALQSIASLYFQMKRMEKSKDWHHKVLDAVPDYKESYYTIGVICWTQSYEPRLQLRAELGMQQEDPGPIGVARRLNRNQREGLAEVAEEVVPIIEEGLEALELALAIDQDYDDAMAYVNLLYRERADFAETKAEYDEYLDQADEWVQKALDTRKRKAEESTIEAFTTDE